MTMAVIDTDQPITVPAANEKAAVADFHDQLKKDAEKKYLDAKERFETLYAQKTALNLQVKEAVANLESMPDYSENIKAAQQHADELKENLKADRKKLRDRTAKMKEDQQAHEKLMKDIRRFEGNLKRTKNKDKRHETSQKISEAKIQASIFENNLQAGEAEKSRYQNMIDNTLERIEGNKNSISAMRKEHGSQKKRDAALSQYNTLSDQYNMVIQDLPKAQQEYKDAKKLFRKLGGKTESTIKNFFTKDRLVSFGIGGALGLTATTALTPIGLGALSGIAVALVRVGHGKVEKGAGFKQNTKNILGALRERDTYKKVGIAAAFGLVGAGTGLLINDYMFSADAAETTAVLDINQPVIEANTSSTGKEITNNVTGGGNNISNTTVENNTNNSITNNVEGGVGEINNTIDNGNNNTTIGNDNIKISPTPVETTRITLTELTVSTDDVVDAGSLVDTDMGGTVHNDMELVENFMVTANEIGGVDADLIEAVEAKMANTDFIMSADAIKVVDAYNTELAAGLADGKLTVAEYQQSLGKVFAVLADPETNFVVNREGIPDDVEAIDRELRAKVANQNNINMAKVQSLKIA